jgi:hypothetical protein
MRLPSPLLLPFQHPEFPLRLQNEDETDPWFKNLSISHSSLLPNFQEDPDMALPARPISFLLYDQNVCDPVHGIWRFKISNWPHIHCYGVAYVMLEACYFVWYKMQFATASSLFLPLHQNIHPSFQRYGYLQL